MDKEHPPKVAIVTNPPGDDADSADEDAWELVEKPHPPPPCSGAPEVDLWLNTSVH